MRDVALRAGYALHQSKLVELNHGFGQVKIDRTAALALAVEDHGQLAHELKRWHQRGVALAGGGIIFEDGVDRGVRHALSGADYAFGEFISDDFAAMIDFHYTREHQTVDLRPQAADVR